MKLRIDLDFRCPKCAAKVQDSLWTKGSGVDMYFDFKPIYCPDCSLVGCAPVQMDVIVVCKEEI